MTTYDGRGMSDAVQRAGRALIDAIAREDLTRLRPDGPRSETPGEPAGPGCARFRASSLAAVRDLLENVRRLMFPGFFDADPPWDGELDAHVSRVTERIAAALHDEVRSVLRYRRRPEHAGDDASARRLAAMDEQAYVRHVVSSFLDALPRVRAMLAEDVQAAYDGDPAAEHTDEIILCYPGLDAIFTHRVAHELYRLGVPVLPRVMSEQAHSRTGIDIHPGARIGQQFFIDHGSATVIGETSVIGRQVKIYQGVTLGARSFPKDDRGRAIRGLKRHPTIGDRVTIYAGAVILGGDTVIGDDSVIAGGVFVISSVPPGHVVQQTRPELVLKPTGVNGAASGNAGGHGPRADQSKRFIAMPPGEASWLDAGAGI